MRYDFIAEFFAAATDLEPIYRTHLNDIQDEEGFIKENGFVGVTDTSDYDYLLETDVNHLNGIVSGESNPEMLAICFEGDICERVRITAYEFCAGEASFIGFCYGDDYEYCVVFSGNRPDDEVTIETHGGPITAPLRILKEIFNVSTLFEVVDRLETRIKGVLKSGL